MILCDMTQRFIQSTENSIQSANSQSANSQSANSYDANCRHLSMCMPQMTAEQIEAQIAQIKQDCQAQGLRFTALREQVYRLILLAAQPIGAYELGRMNYWICCNQRAKKSSHRQLYIVVWSFCSGMAWFIN